MSILPGLNGRGVADGCTSAVPDPADVPDGACLPAAQRDQLINGAAGTGNVTGDGRSDPVAMLGNPLPIVAPDGLPPAVELGVAAYRGAAAEVSEKDQISGGPGQASKALR
ncbi:hypothetical protein K1Y78_14220 [Streptomyces sp. tea 10]|nr:hypothetical protein [Streptomyces sp. tea 10]